MHCKRTSHVLILQERWRSASDIVHNSMNRKKKEKKCNAKRIGNSRLLKKKILLEVTGWKDSFERGRRGRKQNQGFRRNS